MTRCAPAASWRFVAELFEPSGVPNWLLLLGSIGWLVALIWHGRMSYRHGIWDGAFNQFLPVVKREMEFYRRTDRG